MPVDLSLIPAKAQRKPPPSLKRWSVVLLAFLAAGGFITSWLWPAEKVTRGALFWHCFISAPLLLWLLMLMTRWLSWLVSEWLADGWDSEREWDKTTEILRGQRFLQLEAFSIYLPQHEAPRCLSEQFALVQPAVIVPALDDKATERASNQTADNNAAVTLAVLKIIQCFSSLLTDIALHDALARCMPSQRLKVVVQISCQDVLTEQDTLTIEQFLVPLLPVGSRIVFSAQFGLADIDNWLDNPGSLHSLLIISVDLRTNSAQGEVAVALLLHCAESLAIENCLAHLHRPEKTKENTTFKAAALQSLQWGATGMQEISHLWLAGIGSQTQAQTLLAGHDMQFPLKEGKGQLIDIDSTSGHAGVVSPWLAIAMAARNINHSASAQWVMSMPEQSNLPWWLVIQPVLIEECVD